MTTHFEAMFKGSRPQKVPHCKRFAMRPMWGVMTTDQTKVDCKACAKALGIVPAAKPEGKNKTGTCQCCFRGQKVSKGQGTLLSLHGYTRPGHGYIIGRCRGEAELPYEVSCERTKFFRAEVQTMKAAQEAYLAKLNNNEVESLPARISTGKRVPDLRYPGYDMTKMEYVTIDVKRGMAEFPNPYMLDKPWEKVPSFESLRQAEVRDTLRTIEHMADHIAFLTEKIDTWKKVW